MKQHVHASTLQPVQRRLLIPVAAGMVTLAIGYSVALIWLRREHHQQEIDAILEGASYSLEADLDEQIDDMLHILHEIQHEADIVPLLARSDRTGLLEQLTPVMNRLRESEHITHLYVHDLERRVVMRAHKPEHFGDQVDRFSVLEAERTGKPAFALELGSLGLLTLRVVVPVKRGSKRLGYVELGKELEAILEELAERHHVQHIAMIEKRHLDRELWQEGMAGLGRTPEWDRFGGSVIGHSSFSEELPSEVDRLATQAEPTDQIQYLGRTWQTLRYPLRDQGLGPVGSLILLRDISDARAQFLELVAAVSAGSVLVLILLCGSLYVVMRRVDHGIVAQQQALLVSQAELQRHRDHLEELVRERTQQLEQAQSSLLESSRVAGMAEVATGVLHNVGNILTSANTSIEVLLSRIHRSRVDGVAKVSQLLREHEHDLAHFVTNDPRGQRLPSYVHKLSEQLLREQDGLISEMSSLRGFIDTIKQTIAVQQSFARTSGVKESVRPQDLIEDVLTMTGHAFAKFDIVVERDYEELGPQLLERGKILQILANLVENAVQALTAGQPGGAKRLLLAVARVDRKLHFRVQDDGIGIAAEDLTRIFHYGYTTRANGHGFGLHHSANAAGELGGRLWATSSGLGRGATFHLEVPVQTEKSPADD